MPLTSADLKAVQYGGMINEEVMQEIFDISRIPLPFTDLIGGADSVSNSYTEWPTERLADPDITNAHVDGEDTIDNQDVKTGERVGNHCQISTKTVKVSTRADESNTIGSSRELAKQVMRRQQELRRDVEAISLVNQASQADDGDAVPGKAGGLPAWLKTNFDTGSGATAGGFANGTVAAYTPGTKRAGTETMVKDMVQQIYEGGGDPTILMSVPAVIRGFNEFLFDNSAKIATLTGNTGADGGGNQLVAKGSVNVYVADHGQVLTFVPNRLQQLDGQGSADLFVLDPAYVRHGMLHGYRVEPLAKTGLAEKRQMAVDWTLKVLNEEAHGVIPEIDPALAWAA